MSKVYPVIHHDNIDLSLQQRELALDCGADGVFLISHNGKDDELMDVVIKVKKDNPATFVGVNFLGEPDPIRAYHMAETLGADAVWLDNAGVSSTDTSVGVQLKDARNARLGRAMIFASVAFKYQPHEPEPELAALAAKGLGFIPTTSGAGTGRPPEVAKIQAMSQATHGVLAVASGMTPENVDEYAPFLSHILVATGVSLDMHHFDYEKLSRFVGKVRSMETIGVVGRKTLP